MRSIFVLLLSMLVTSLVAQQENLQIDIPQGPKPWTSLEVDVPSEQFQFAIVTDRTGGLRSGVFSKAVDKINLLRPQFVMSVGDLIEGYTEDRVQLTAEWNEFDAMVNRLKMPFFYLPGNHDITNQVMEDVYKERYGATYYHFVYKDILFLCLNSEDQKRGSGRGTISEEQFAYIQKVLAENETVRWTMVFLHQPLWEQEDPVQWPAVEALLAQREHTVFAGHVHHYVKYTRNNGRYYTLGTTGGSSRLRGPRLGEFDHITWVTMTEDGPIIANLALDGIYSDSVTTQQDYAFIQSIYASKPVRFKFGVKRKDGYSVTLKLSNPTDLPAQVRIKPGFSFDYLLNIPTDTITVPPNNVKEVRLEVTPKSRRVKGGSVPLDLDWNYQYEGEVLRMPLSYRLAIEAERRTLPLGRAQVDGVLDDWEVLPYRFAHGEEGDMEVEWGVSYDEDYLYMAARVKDDAVVVRSGETAWKEDYLSFIVNAEPYEASVLNTGSGWYEDSYILLAAPAQGEIAAADFYQERYDFEVQYKSICTGDGYVMEAAIPLAYVIDKQGADWKHLRINVGAQDEDPDEAEKARFGWMPNWRGRDNVVGSGVFWRE